MKTTQTNPIIDAQTFTNFFQDHHAQIHLHIQPTQRDVTSQNYFKRSEEDGLCITK